MRQMSSMVFDFSVVQGERLGPLLVVELGPPPAPLAAGAGRVEPGPGPLADEVALEIASLTRSSRAGDRDRAHPQDRAETRPEEVPWRFRHLAVIEGQHDAR